MTYLKSTVCRLTGLMLLFAVSTSGVLGMPGKPKPAKSRSLPANQPPQSPINDRNWQQHPQIRAIRQIVQAIDVGMKKKSYKMAERKFESCPDQYFTLRRIARDTKGAVAWYQEYSEGEDSSWDYNYYYDNAQRLRFVLVTVYAANSSREQHRAYYDEAGKLIWQNRRKLRGPGYFAPQNMDELPSEDPNKEFANAEGCVEIKPKARKS